MSIKTIAWTTGGRDNIYVDMGDGIGNETLSITSDPNTGAARSKTINVVTGNIVRNIIVTQEATPTIQEIEYLQSSGTQYIDTGVTPHQNLKVEIKWKNTSTQNNKYLFGSGTSNSNCIRAYIGNSANWRFGGAYKGLGTQNTTTRTAIFDRTKLTINNVDYTYSGTVGTFSSTTTIKLFAGATGNSKISCNIYYFKIYNNNTLILNLVPVRVGQVGYMYDTISEQLYGNIGTGSFTLGPDITS